MPMRSPQPSPPARPLLLALLLLAPLALQAAAGAPSGEFGARIVGGDQAAPGAWPFIAALVQASVPNANQGQFCGGSLVAPRWVLTAAHCVTQGGAQVPAAGLHVVLGRSQLSDGAAGERIAVAEIVRHPGYDDASFANDVALLRLAAPSAQPAVRLVGPAAQDLARWNPGTTAWAIGWGNTENDPPGTPTWPDDLRQVAVPLVSDATCAGSYGASLRAAIMLCAGFAAGGKDACQGDSGGPLLVADDLGDGWLQAGVVSWGIGCAEPNQYGVYAEVAAFTEWIQATAGLDLALLRLDLRAPHVGPFTLTLPAGDGATEACTVDPQARTIACPTLASPGWPDVLVPAGAATVQADAGASFASFSRSLTLAAGRTVVLGLSFPPAAALLRLDLRGPGVGSYDVALAGPGVSDTCAVVVAARTVACGSLASPAYPYVAGPAGTWTIDPTAAGYDGAQRTVRASAGRVAVAPVVLAPAQALLHLDLRSPWITSYTATLPLPGGGTEACAVDVAAASIACPTLASPSYPYVAMAPGTVAVQADAGAGFAPFAKGGVRLVAGQVARVAVSFPPTEALLRLAPATPVAGAFTVTLPAPGGGTEACAVDVAARTIACASLASPAWPYIAVGPGALQALAAAAGFGDVSATTSARAGGVHALTLRFTPVGSVLRLQLEGPQLGTYRVAVRDAAGALLGTCDADAAAATMTCAGAASSPAYPYLALPAGAASLAADGGPGFEPVRKDLRAPAGRVTDLRLRFEPRA